MAKTPSAPHGRRRSKYALPNIETTPSRASTVRTQAEHDANVREYETATQARLARAQGRTAKSEAAIEKERRRRVAARTPPPPPAARRPDAKPKAGEQGGTGAGRARGTTPGRRRRRSSKRGGLFGMLPSLPASMRGNPRSILVAEMVTTSLVVTAGRLGKGEAPELGDYVPVWLVFLFLTLGVTISKGTERVAIALGGLVLVAVTLRDAAPLTHALAVASTGGHARARGGSRGGGKQGVPSAGPGSGVRDFGPHGGVHGGPHPGGPRSNR